jgi:hypothetical protein
MQYILDSTNGKKTFEEGTPVVDILNQLETHGYTVVAMSSTNVSNHNVTNGTTQSHSHHIVTQWTLRKI